MTGSALNSILEDQGYRVHLEPDTDRILEILTLFEPDLILIARRFKTMGVVPALEFIKQSPFHHNIPVIHLTASNDNEKEALALGVYSVIPKPIDLNRLLIEIDFLTKNS